MLSQIVAYLSAGQIQKGFDVQIIRGQDDLEEGLLLNVHVPEENTCWIDQSIRALMTCPL